MGHKSTGSKLNRITNLTYCSWHFLVNLNRLQTSPMSLMSSDAFTKTLTHNSYFVFCDLLVSFAGGENLGPLKNGNSEPSAQAPGPMIDDQQNTLVLASKRTNRPDILRGFRRYRDGWDISNPHYWAVSFSKH